MREILNILFSGEILKYESKKFSDIFDQNKIKFYYRYTHNELPNYFQNFDYKENQEIHLHDTRIKCDCHTNKVKRVYAENCIRNEIPHFINKLDPSIKDKIGTHSLKSVLSLYKSKTILGYNFVCTDRHCYSCNTTLKYNIN